MDLKLQVTIGLTDDLSALLRSLLGAVSLGAVAAGDAPKAARGPGRPPKAPDAPSDTAASPGPATTQADTSSALSAGQTATPTASPSSPTPAAAPAASEPAGNSAVTQTAAVSATPATHAEFQAAMMATVKAINAATVQRVLKESTGQTTPASVKPEQYGAAIAALNAAVANKAAA